MNISGIRFGTSGNPPNFLKSKYKKKNYFIVDWLKEIGLNEYEVLMTYGARITDERLDYLTRRSKELDIALSVHAPYYVVLTSEDKKVRENSINELIKTLNYADQLGTQRVVLHPGFTNKPYNLKLCIEGLKEVYSQYSGKAIVLPETMGKKSQLGSLDDVLEICREVGLKPCIDFAHLHARDLGVLYKEEDFRNIIIKIEKVLGKEGYKNLHCHFYPVEFTDKGEKVHRAVMEHNVYPQFKFFAPIIKEFDMKPYLVSESHDSQDIGALEMRNILLKI